MSLHCTAGQNESGNIQSEYDCQWLAFFTASHSIINKPFISAYEPVYSTTLRIRNRRNRNRPEIYELSGGQNLFEISIFFGLKCNCQIWTFGRTEFIWNFSGAVPISSVCLFATGIKKGESRGVKVSRWNYDEYKKLINFIEGFFFPLLSSGKRKKPEVPIPPLHLHAGGGLCMNRPAQFRPVPLIKIGTGPAGSADPRKWTLSPTLP